MKNIDKTRPTLDNNRKNDIAILSGTTIAGAGVGYCYAKFEKKEQKRLQQSIINNVTETKEHNVLTFEYDTLIKAYDEPKYQSKLLQLPKTIDGSKPKDILKNLLDNDDMAAFQKQIEKIKKIPKSLKEEPKTMGLFWLCTGIGAAVGVGVVLIKNFITKSKEKTTSKN